MNKQRIAIVDCHFICHAVKHSTRNLSYRGNKTGVIYGFLQKLMTVAGDLYQVFNEPINNWIFAWESEYRKRKEIYPDYKADRIIEDKILHEITLPQFFRVKETVLPNLGFENVIEVYGYEADDIIAAYTKYHKKVDWFIITRDNDMYQLLRDYVSFYNPVDRCMYTEQDYRDEYGLAPDSWSILRSLAGGKNNIIDIPNIGIKTAVDFIKGKIPEGSRKDKIIKDHHKEVMLNHDLVFLPYGTFPFEEVKNINVNVCTTHSFIRVCDEFGFKKFLKDEYIEKWARLFCGGI